MIVFLYRSFIEVERKEAYEIKFLLIIIIVWLNCGKVEVGSRFPQTMYGLRGLLISRAFRLLAREQLPSPSALIIIQTQRVPMVKRSVNGI